MCDISYKYWNSLNIVSSIQFFLSLYIIEYVERLEIDFDYLVKLIFVVTYAYIMIYQKILY